ncbi:hypothetical protein EG340_17390 [Chryseobacterium indoltheticum]|uniref:Uncharacterized protein n=2 Tax=Chryseobacterium indoltheticum TaxID=254 RepID=A0A3G6NCP9_9FLAO|nr:hypothetical protein EG340_17390 [Chryseobacterium indoltheticum]
MAANISIRIEFYNFSFFRKLALQNSIMIKTLCFFLFFVSTYHFAQKFNPAIEIEKRFANNNKKYNVGSVYYKNGSEVKKYKDSLLEKTLQDYSFYIFSLQQKDCYTYSTKKAIAIFKSDKFFQIQYGLSFLANDLGLNQKFIDIFAQLKFKDQNELEVFVNHVAKILFQTNYYTDYKMTSSSLSKLVFESENNIITFKIKDLSIYTIDFMMKL